MEKIKPAIILSVLSSPSSLPEWKRTDFSAAQICNKINFSKVVTQEVIAGKYSPDPVIASEMIIETCLKKKINIISVWDDEYPYLLKEIYKPPFVIYSIGEMPLSEMVSIVGTRKSDSISENITKKIASAISIAGYTIVSGMAMGIDRAAHIGALSASGKTIAVLPGGVDLIYPLKNSDIYRMISESGCVVSEYPPGICPSFKWTFARRNRIISGMSRAVIVTQAPVKSGAMITAMHALEQNRDLFACPGNAFDEKYRGCNKLIRQGAIIMSEIDDFFSELNPEYNTGEIIQVTNTPDFEITKHKVEIQADVRGETEKVILTKLANGGMEIDELIRKSNLLTDEVNRSVTMMEIEGLIYRKGNMIFRKK